MKAGRELDALVAEKVMGWVIGDSHIAVDQWCCGDDDTGWLVESPNDFDDLRCYNGVWCPSVDILTAWDVLEHLDLSWWPEVGRMNDGTWYCEICKGGDQPMDVGPPFRAEAKTAQLAICLAALKVVGVEVPA